MANAASDRELRPTEETPDEPEINAGCCRAAHRCRTGHGCHVGVSINIGQPDFYGRLDVNDYPRPRVIYAQPVIIERHRVVEQPVYVRVPSNYRKDWRRYCGRYDACGRPV